jgi:hypothetical protein
MNKEKSYEKQMNEYYKQLAAILAKQEKKARDLKNTTKTK